MLNERYSLTCKNGSSTEYSSKWQKEGECKDKQACVGDVQAETRDRLQRTEGSRCGLALGVLDDL